jgi:hypothetical protein
MLRGIDFREVSDVVGERGKLEVQILMKDGTSETLESYPGEDFYMKCRSWLSQAKRWGADGGGVTPPSDRVEKIHGILEEYYGGEAEDEVTAVLADVRHYCEAYGIGFERADRLAFNHYVAETNGLGRSRA